MGIGGKASPLLARHADRTDGGVFQPVGQPARQVAGHPLHALYAALQQSFNQFGGDVHRRWRGTRRTIAETTPENTHGPPEDLARAVVSGLMRTPQRGLAMARRSWPQAAS